MYLKHQLGKYGEKIACNYLEQKQYQILEKNYTCKQGEIDIIVIDKKSKEIVFFEVKTRQNFIYGLPVEAVNCNKQKHILKVAKYYLYKNQLYKNFIRFDVIEVYVYHQNFRINHIKQAFEM